MKRLRDEGAGDFRDRAEEGPGLEPAESRALTAAEAREIIHELQKRQIELEGKNEELRSAQERLEESCARYYDLYESAPISYFTLNKQGLVVATNLTGARQLGVKREHLVDTPLTVYIAAQDRRKFLSYLDSLFTTQKQQNCEIKLMPKEGEAFFGMVEGVFVPDSDKEFCSISISDISERKQMEEALRALLLESLPREKEISALLEGARAVLACHEFKDAARAIFGSCKTSIGASGGYISLSNAEGTENVALFIDSGDRSCEVDPDLPMPLRGMREVVLATGKGLIHNHFAQSEFVELLPEGHIAMDNVLFAPMVVKGKPVGLLGLANKPGGFTENDLRLASGFAELAAIALVNTWVEQNLRQTLDRQEQLVDERTAQLVAANRQLRKEIQHHGKTHKKLLRTEELYRQTAENIRGVLWILNREQAEMLYVNPAYEKVWERTCESLYADPKSWLDAVHPEDFEEVRRIAGAKDTNGFDCEYRILSSDGSVRWIWSRSFPIRNRSGKVYRIAGIAEDITERKRTEESLRESEQRLRFLSSSLLTAQENERRRIAHELHDSVGASLVLIKFGLRKISKDIERGIATIDAGSTLISTTQNVIDEVRRIMGDLRPSMLDDVGLVRTIDWFCQQFRAVHSDIGIEGEIAVDEADIPAPLKIVIFRIMQEAMNNIAKHSKASQVRLFFVNAKSSLQLSIEDNGAGFDLRSVSSEIGKRGLGLTSMQERAELSGGRMTIESILGVGTIIRASWPHDLSEVGPLCQIIA